VTISPGTRLGPYEVIAKLGEGGMGEVFRARDTKLDRDVALKVLPAAFTEDPDRLARFEREAKLLAQLHHPHIASIFGLEESGGVRALVMELVEGPTLADRLAGGALDLDETLQIAKQIAEALEAAHEKGIVHRDLKPQNVKLSGDGAVKVLDFGLAKAMDPTAAASGAPTASPTLVNSPTLTAAGTQLGVILGTAAYMAPEQARGLAVDKRADVWAFGVLLWEMLAGRRLFGGELVTDVLAAVLRQEVDLDALPAGTPPPIRRLVRRCLARKPRERLHDIADARIVLDEALAGDPEAVDAGPPPATPRRARGWIALPWILAAIFGFQLLLKIAIAPGDEAGPRRALEVSVPTGQLLTDDAPLAFAPDGSAIAFSALDTARGTRLWLRRLASFDVRPLHGTEGATAPFWSPDSKSVGFFRTTDQSLCRYELATGQVQLLARDAPLGRGAAWLEGGALLFVPDANTSIRRIHLDGSPEEELTRLDPEILDGSHRWPAPLPDGKHFLFTLWSNHLETAARLGGVYLASYEKGVVRKLTPDISQAVLAGPDRILVRRDDTLVALPFDPERLEVTGPGEKLADRPLYSTSSGALAATASRAGDLAFALDSAADVDIVWLDRAGEPTGSVAFGEQRVVNLALSPDGESFAVEAGSARGGGIWVGDVRRQVLNRITREAVDSSLPVWAPDGRRIAFTSEAGGSQEIFLQPSDGSRSAERLLGDPEKDFEPISWSRDGRFLMLNGYSELSRRSAVWLYDFEDASARELLAEPAASTSQPTLSPDGRFLAYVSDEAGNPEIYVRPFPALDRKWKISQGGALSPHWRADGRELLYLGLADRAVYAVDVDGTGTELVVGAPRALFTPRTPFLAFAPAPDHQRFLAAVFPGDVRAEPIRVIFGGHGPVEEAERR